MRCDITVTTTLQERECSDDSAYGGEYRVGSLPVPTGDAVERHDPAADRGDCSDSGELSLGHIAAVHPHRRDVAMSRQRPR